MKKALRIGIFLGILAFSWMLFLLEEELAFYGIAESGKYCPMVLLYCGYYYECCGSEDNCTLKKYLKYSVDE